MNAVDILLYGNRTLISTFEAFPSKAWTRSGACGWWSVKDIMAHLTSYEHVLVEVLGTFSGVQGPTPNLTHFLSGPGFNDSEVAARADKSTAEILAEYREAHEQTMGLIKQIPVAKRAEVGTIPWYGDPYALDDLLVYQYYGHKREHSAQIAAFRDIVVAEG